MKSAPAALEAKGPYLRTLSARQNFSDFMNGGWSRNRTGVRGVAVHCMATLPSSLTNPAAVIDIVTITDNQEQPAALHLI